MIHEQKEGTIISFKQQGEQYNIIGSNQVLTKFSELKQEPEEVRLNMLESPLFEDDFFTDVCISESILTTTNSMITISSGVDQGPMKKLGLVDKADFRQVHTDENLIVTADFTQLPSLKFTAHNNPGSRFIRFGDEKFTTNLLSVH